VERWKRAIPVTEEYLVEMAAIGIDLRHAIRIAIDLMPIHCHDPGRRCRPNIED
jgi:hypothetical protein